MIWDINILKIAESFFEIPTPKKMCLLYGYKISPNNNKKERK